MIENPSFSSTLSKFLTISCFYHVFYFAFEFLLIFCHFGTSRDTKKRCTGPVFLPLGASWAGFGAVLGNSWKSLGRQSAQDAPKSPQDLPKRPPDLPKRPPRPPKTSKIVTQIFPKSPKKHSQGVQVVSQPTTRTTTTTAKTATTTAIYGVKKVKRAKLTYST